MGEVADAYIASTLDGRSPASWQPGGAPGVRIRYDAPPRKTFGLNLRGRDLSMVPNAAGVYVPLEMVEDEDHDYPHISASQVKTWDICIRKWWLEKVAKVKQRGRAHFDVGHALHHISERYQLRQAPTWEGIFDEGWDKKLDPDMSTWIRTMAGFAVQKGLWQATEDVQVEYPMAMLVGRDWVDDRGMPWLVHADSYMGKDGVRHIRRPTKLIDGRPLPVGWDTLPVFVGFVDQCYLTRNPPEVGDHKSAKNRRYATTVEKLEREVQMLTYSAGVLAHRRDAQFVNLRHNVFLKSMTDAEGAYEVRAIARLDQVRNEWARVIQIAEDMRLLREARPVVIDPNNKFARANAFAGVKSAIEAGCAKESCSMYGGCPFKAACHGHMTMEGVVRQLDAPPLTLSVFGAAPQPTKSFGLNPGAASSQAQPPRRFGLNHPTLRQAAASAQEQVMPFVAKPATPPQPTAADVYLLDVENPSIQYRVREVPGSQVPDCTHLALWPHVDIEPMWAELPQVYLLQDWERSKLSSLPFPNAALTGYHAALLGANMAEGSAWKDARGVVHSTLVPDSPLQSPTAANAALSQPFAGMDNAKVPAGGEDKRFGLNVGGAAPGVAQGKLQPGVGSALAAQTARAVAANSEPMPQADFVVKEGQVVEVLPSADKPFFNALKGQQGKVTAVVGVPPEQTLSVVMIDGTPLENVATGRFKLISEPAAPAMGIGAPPDAMADYAKAMEAFKGQVATFKGTEVSLTLKSGAAPTRIILEDVTAEGLVALAGALKVKWEDVQDVTQVPAGTPVAGAKVSKPRGKKAQAAAAAAAASGTPPISTGTVPTAGAPVVPPTTPGVVPPAPALHTYTPAEIQAKLSEVTQHYNNLGHTIAQLQTMLASLK